MSGPQLKTVANFAEPYKSDFCNRIDCYVCKSADRPTLGKCWLEGVGYTIKCKVCLGKGIESIYIGET